MSNSTAPKNSGENQTPAKFAVVRLKPGDNLLGLFQLLIGNGFGEVSFVNNLSETIFPAIAGVGVSRRVPSPQQQPTTKKDKNSSVQVEKNVEKASQSNKANGDEKPLSHITTSNEHFKQPPSQASLPIRSAPFESRMAPSAEPIINQKLNIDNDDLPATRPKKPALEMGSVPQRITSNESFSTTPSTFLGLPTMPSLNTSAAAAAAIAALSEATTPPYSLGNFFSPNSLSTSIPPAVLIQPPTNGTGHQFGATSGALLAAAAAAAQQGQAAVTSTVRPHPRAATLQTLPNVIPQLPAQAQQRIHMSQAVYPFQQQLQLQSRLAFPLQQQPQPKPIPQKSPPITSSNSNSNSSVPSTQARSDGMLSSNIVPMPPGCATTQLRQRGQRSYAEDPSLYVACRLCKNKIMGSRISNLTNHVRRHSSMKQFGCCYCDYTHNEMAKVRLHMLHNHKDKDSQPIDNLSPEMQASWDLLMKECFPDHCQQQQHIPLSPNQANGIGSGVASIVPQHLQVQSQPTSAIVKHLQGEQSLQHVAYNQIEHRRSESTSTGSIETISPHDEKNFDHFQVLVKPGELEINLSPTSSVSTSSIANDEACPQAIISPSAQQQLVQQRVARCMECGVYVNTKMKARHIRKCHLQCLLPFACSMCGYDHSEHSKVKVHICLKHDDDPMAQVVTRDLSTYAEHLVPEYFLADSEIQYTPSSIQHTQTQIRPSVQEPVAASVNYDSVPSTEVDMTQQVETKSTIVYIQADTNSRTRKKLHTRSLKCDVCRRIVGASKAVHHVRKHLSITGSSLQCSQCEHYRTSNLTRLRRHLETRHGLGRERANQVVVQRARRVAVAGNVMKRAVERCFPGSKKIRWIVKAVVRRYKKIYCLRKRVVGNRKSHRMIRKVLASKQRIKRELINKKIDGVNQTSVIVMSKNPNIKKEAKMETQTEHVSTSDLFRMCPLCAHWIRSDQLTSHLQSHVPSMGSAYRCNLCEFTAADTLLVKTHYSKEHQKQTPLLMPYANMCRASSSTATAADG